MADRGALTAGEIEGFARRLRALRDTYLATGTPGAATAEAERVRLATLQAETMPDDVARRRAIAMACIEVALQRVERGEYGRCTACGATIDRRRLKADPAVVHCATCDSQSPR